MQRNSIWYGVCICLFLWVESSGQRPFEGRPYREVGLNLTGLLTQVVPFNRGGGQIGPYSLHMYIMSKKNRGLRISMGGQVTDGLVTVTDHINLLVGFERRKWIGGGKFVYRRGLGGYANIIGFNTSLIRDQSDDGAVGLVLSRGIEYHPWPSISFFAEAQIYIGSAGFGTQLLILPPVSIHANVKF